MSTRTFPRRSLLAALAAGALLAVSFTPSVQAYDETSHSEVNVDATGVALKGYDPVSYFKAGGPLLGSPKYSAKHEGATYHFASAANKAAFEKDPAHFAPQFGGYCAMGVALNHKLDVDPALWRVVDGKLYLNVHKGAQQRWLEDTQGNITQARANWTTIRGKAETELQ